MTGSGDGRPGGRTATRVGTGGAAVGPGGRAVGGRTSAGTVSGPRGGAAGVSHKGTAIGPGGAVHGSYRGGVAVLASHRLKHPAARLGVWITAVLAILLIATSRVYLGVHYPTDVLGGMSAGVVWVGAVALGDRLAEHRRRRRR